MENKYYFLAAICILTHVVRTAYEILKHNKIIKAGKTSFIIMFTNMAVLWASWFSLCLVDERIIEIPDLVRYLGIVLAAAGLVLFLSGLLTIKTLETYDGDLITKGIYSKIRHPMYLGFIFWLIGFPVYTSALNSMILAIPFILNVLYWRYLEERELLARFYDYTEYRRRTWF